MAAYEAVVTLKQGLSTIIDYAGLWLSKYHPSSMELLQFAVKQLKSFQEFVERLDMKSRMRMKVPLQQIVEATKQFPETFGPFFEDAMGQPEVRVDESEDTVTLYPRHGYGLFSELKVNLDKSCRAVQGLRRVVHSFINQLRRVEKLEEYLNVQDEDEADHVDSGGKMVGLSDVYSELKRCVISEQVDDLVVSLVGMIGIGKTTLAKKLFEDLDVLEWFDCFVWVTVGIQFQPEEITQILQPHMDLEHPSDEGYFRKGFKHGRYIIVLDDVCEMKLCHSYINRKLRGIPKGSKVLLTTRIQDNSLSHHLIHMRLLDQQESWHLLCDKVFAQNSCPLDLEKAGKMIAEKCDGLPLTIVTVANLLSKTSESLWIQVATQKKHKLFVEAYDEISKVLYPSYAILSEDLKLCFLYMGVFPQNDKIRRSKLINLWIAEKIIRKSYFQTLEDSGVEVLQRLAMHSFVMIYQRSTIMFDDLTERIKMCGLHSSWWQFCHREAKKFSFFHILDSYTDALEEILKSQSRLTIHNNILFGIKVVNKSLEENCAFTTHSLLCLGPYHQYPVPICFGLKFLKKLDALQIRFYQFPLEVLKLVKLRYLALTCNASVPPSISKLLKLQSLIVHQHLSVKCGNLSYLPVEIWHMKGLKHLHVTGNDLPDVNGTLLPNLLTLSAASLSGFTDDVIEGMPNLEKLGIRIDILPNEPSFCFNHISRLKNLKSLKCVIVYPACNFKVVAPLFRLSIYSSSLKKLYLSGLGYPWVEVSMISSLPNLEVLKLRSNAFQGPKWVVEDYEFPMLRCLIMEDLDLVALMADYESFRCLKKVSIKHCYNLKTFRLRADYKFATNSSEVIDCNPLVGREMQKSILLAEKFPEYFSIHSSWNS